MAFHAIRESLEKLAKPYMAVHAVEETCHKLKKYRFWAFYPI